MGSLGFMGQQKLRVMTREDLVETIKKILKTDLHLNFLLKLETGELETLVVCLRDWASQGGK